MLSKQTTIVLSVLTGVGLELGVHALSGRSEAWDSTQYWALGLPIVAAVSVGIGFLARGMAWTWTVAIIPSQVMTMMVRSGELGALWPLALVAAAILSAPFLLCAFIGSRFRSHTQLTSPAPAEAADRERDDPSLPGRQL